MHILPSTPALRRSLGASIAVAGIAAAVLLAGGASTASEPLSDDALPEHVAAALDAIDGTAVPGISTALGIVPGSEQEQRYLVLHERIDRAAAQSRAGDGRADRALTELVALRSEVHDAEEELYQRVQNHPVGEAARTAWSGCMHDAGFAVSEPGELDQALTDAIDAALPDPYVAPFDVGAAAVQRDACFAHSDQRLAEVVTDLFGDWYDDNADLFGDYRSALGL